jgi:hypothetical protein
MFKLTIFFGNVGSFVVSLIFEPLVFFCCRANIRFHDDVTDDLKRKVERTFDEKLRGSP